MQVCSASEDTISMFIEFQLRIPEPWLTQIILFEFSIQVSLTDSQNVGGFFPVVVCQGQRVFDRPAFNFF